MSEPHPESAGDNASPDSKSVVSDCVTAGREAMKEISEYDQAEADRLAQAAAWAVYTEDNAESLIETTMDATEMGAPRHKREKLRDRTKGILMDTLGEPSVGEIPCDRDGVVELAKPVGIVGGLVPSTNPASTAVNLAILALKGRNALILSASPAGLPPTAEAVEYIREELAHVGAPRDLVQVLPGEPSKAKAHALLKQADLTQVTGSSANVRAGQESGTPNYCVSEGNPVAILDQSVDPERVATTLVDSAAYDHGTACIAESCAVVPDEMYPAFRSHLSDAGAYCCDATESSRIRKALFPNEGHQPDRQLVGRPAEELAAQAGVDVPAGTTLLAVEPDDIKSDPLVTECLAPVIATISVPDFEAGLDATDRILEREGAGHSAAIHTHDRERAVVAGRQLNVCRAVINQPNLGSSGSVANGLTHSLSMGGGTWAGNQLAENLSYRQFIQTTRIAFPTEGEDPSDAAVFSPYVDEAADTNDLDDTDGSTQEPSNGGNGILRTLSKMLQ